MTSSIPEFRQVPLQAMLRLARQWHDPQGPGKTLVLAPGDSAPMPETFPESLQPVLALSTTGAFILLGRSDVHLVLPPFPTEAGATLPGWDSSPLVSLLLRDRTTVVLLLRRGGYGIGVYEGEDLVVSKVGSRYVHGRNRKGGSSSGRFARRREEQTHALMDKTCEVLRQRLEPYQKPIAHFLLGGDRLLLQAFLDRCPYLQRFASLVLDRHLDLPDPTQRMLNSLPRMIYSGRVASLRIPETAMPNAQEHGR